MRKKEIKINRIKDFSKYQGCYCLIRRSGNEVGLFSHFLTNLGNIALAINYGLIPVIDRLGGLPVQPHGREMRSGHCGTE